MDAIKDDWPAVWSVIDSTRVAAGEDMAAFLCWLGVRLMECHRILKDTGSLYLHIDHTAHAYAKCLLDGIFGRRNFRNEIVWHYGKMSNTSKNFPANHDTILRYTKTDDYAFTPLRGDESEYRNRYLRYLTDNQVLYGSVKNSRDKLITGRVAKMEAALLRPLEDDDVLFDFDTEFKVQSDVIYVPIIKGNAKENTGYPTQKPLPLYERIIRASSNPGDMVLDPFCGCATTPIAAERLGRQWIGIDIWAGAYQMVLDRLEQENLKVSDESKRLNFGEVYLRTTPPERTDYDALPAAPDLRLRQQRPPEPWERLSREDMTRILAAAQAHPQEEGVVCAGCGRVLEMEFMELDHITPKSDRGANHILNRILLCRPCNGRKRNHLTLAGLLRENNRPAVKWMRNETLAQLARDNAEKRANWVRDNFGNGEYRAFMAGL